MRNNFTSIPRWISGRFLLVASILLASPSGLRALDPAVEILRAARVNPLGNPVVLDAQLRAGKTKVPFKISVKDGQIIYSFQGADQEIILTLGDDSSSVDERRNGKIRPLSGSRLGDSIHGGLINYEDLAMRFLYWKNPKIIGEETVSSRPAYRIEIPAPPNSSEYASVRVWIDKDHGALLKIEGLDEQGRRIKAFSVNSIQQINGQTLLKQMRVDRIDPISQKATHRTYLEILGKASESP